MSEEKNNENELLSKEDDSETPLNPSNADGLRYDTLGTEMFYPGSLFME